MIARPRGQPSAGCADRHCRQARALPVAMSMRNMPAPSSRCAALRWPAASSTATAIGRGPARPVRDGFVWAAGEAAEIAAVRADLVARRTLANGQIRAASG